MPAPQGDGEAGRGQGTSSLSVAKVYAAPSGWAGRGVGRTGASPPVMAATAFAGEVAQGVLPTAHMGRLRHRALGALPRGPGVCLLPPLTLGHSEEQLA